MGVLYYSSTLAWIDLFFWLAAIAGVSYGIFTATFTIVAINDLEHEYLNTIELCKKVNALTLVEYTSYALLALMMLCNGTWSLFLATLPLCALCYSKYAARRHMLDPTTIFQTKGEVKRHAMAKLAYLVALFFLLLYWFVIAIIYLIGGPQHTPKLWPRHY